IPALSLLVTLLMVVTSIYMWIKVNKTYGLFKGGKINPIPEINVHASANIPRGNVVRIEKKTNGWLTYATTKHTAGLWKAKFL
ncbi:MAG: hypothetical protein J6Y30_08495, partial [Treponema sp.]|nr:hypothetical protein [Treponema sp.]